MESQPILQPLSDQTRRRLNLVFPAAADRAAAERILIHECGSNLPFLEKLGPAELERFRFAAMKLSGGRIEGLRRAVELAKVDWRDLLMAAGFGEDVEAHEGWLAEE